MRQKPLRTGLRCGKGKSCYESDIQRAEVLRKGFGTAGHCAAEIVMTE